MKMECFCMRTEILVYPQVTAIQNMNFISNMVKVFELQFCTVGWGYFLARLIALYSKAFFICLFNRMLTT